MVPEVSPDTFIVRVDDPFMSIVELETVILPVAAASAPGTRLHTSASATSSDRSLLLIDFITFSFLPFPLGRSPW